MGRNLDLVIRGGTLIDGTGSPAEEADVAISDGLITKIGKVIETGREEIDARDRLVIPGFIDIHTHYDAQVTWASQMLPSSCNGVTTVLTGNCGVGFAPVRPDHHDMLISLMEGVEDIPEVVMKEGLPWNWTSFPDYLDSLDSHEYDLDVATQIPHAPLRVFVMGERGARREEATAEDREEMARLAAEGLRAGAFGFSTSRLLQHRTAAGEPIPSYGAAKEELLEIADALAEIERGWIQTVGDFGDEIDAEFNLRCQMAERSGLPLTMSLLQKESRPNEWRDLLDRITQANSSGLKITGQIRGRPTSVLLGFELSLNPFSDCPSWNEVQNLEFDERLAILRDSTFRARLITEPCENSNFQHRYRKWDRIFPLGNPPQYEPEPETSLAKQANRSDVTPEELAYDLMLGDFGRGVLYRPTTNYVDGDLAVVHEMLDHPHTLIGLGDGGAHVGVMCDATDMAHTISYWTRDRIRGPKHNLEKMIYRLTSANAAAIGLSDRGRIHPGLRADINIIDYNALTLQSPKIYYDLPAGGKRLLQQVNGIDATMVAGQPVWRDGDATGALPGRLLRNRV